MARVVWNAGMIEPRSLEVALESPSLAEQVLELIGAQAIDLLAEVRHDERANVRAHWDPGRRRIGFMTGPTADPLDRYFVLLHELGHCASAHVGAREDPVHSRTIEEEAWRWAVAIAEVAPSRRARNGMVQDFKSYLRQPTPFFDPAWDVEDARAEAEAAAWIDGLIATRWPSS
jgi:hypothetical protein